MTTLRDPDGKLWDIPEENVQAAITEGGYSIATPQEVYPPGTNDGLQTAAESAGRTLTRGSLTIAGDVDAQAREAMERQGLDPASLSAEYGPQDPIAPTTAETLAPSLHTEEAKARAVANPGYTAIGQMAAEAPLMLVPGVGANIAVGALAGGFNSEAEDAWQQNRDFSIEAAAVNTGVGLAAGWGLHGLGVGAGKLYDLAKGKVVSLIDAAGERAVKSGADDLLESVATGKQTLDEATAAIQKGQAADPAVRDLADNAGTYRETIAADASKQLQTVRDDFEVLTKRTLRDNELANAVPDNREAQLSWALGMRDELARTAEQLKGAATKEARGLGAAIRRVAKEMGADAEPVEWFRKVATLNEEAATAERALAKRAAKEGGVAAADLEQVAEVGAGMRRGTPEGPLPERVPTASPEPVVPRETPATPREEAMAELTELQRQATSAETQLERDMALSIAQLRAKKLGISLPKVAPEIVAKEADAAKGVQARLIGGLGDENVWGQAAKNELKRFEQWQTRFQGPATAVSLTLFQKASGKADPKKVVAMLRAGSGPTRESLQEWLTTAERVAGHGSSSADAVTRKASERLLEAADGLRSSLAQADLLRVAERRVGPPKTTAQTIKQGALDIGRDALVGGATDYALHQVTDALPAGAATAVMLARRAAKLGKLLGLGELMRSGDRSAIRTMLRPLRVVSNAVEAGGRAITRVPPRVGAIAGSSFSQWSKDPERYEAVTSQIRAMASDPNKMFAHMADSYGDLAQDAPDAYAGLTAQSMRTVQYLASQIPANPRRGLASSRAIIPSEDQRWDFGLKLDAVTNPDSVRDAVRAGTVKPQQVQALAAVYPARYQQLKLDLMEELQAADQAGVVVPIAVRSRIALLFGTMTDPAFSDEVAANVTAARREGLANRVAMRPSSATQSPSAKAVQSPAIASLTGGA